MALPAIKRVVVLGHSGFIGSAVLAAVRARHPDIAVHGLSLGSVDLADPASAEPLRGMLDADTAVIMCAAIKRQLGDSPEIYLKNTQIITTFARLTAENPVARIVYFSSAAVYGEDIENLAITEETPLNPRTYYGLGKMTAEWILSRVASGPPATSLVILRPATVYGPGDMATAYGPSGFLDAAAHGRPIVLWGDGEELREFVFVGDVVEAALALTFSDATGVCNIVSGRSYTFRDALHAVERAVGRLPEISTRPRSKPKVDNRFDNAKLRVLAPKLSFTDLDAGIRLTFERNYQTKRAAT